LSLLFRMFARLRGNPKNTTCRKVVRNQKPTIWPESRTTNASRSLDVFSAIRNRRRVLDRPPIPKIAHSQHLNAGSPHRHPTMQTLTNCQNVAGLWLKYGVAPPMASQWLAGERARFAAQKKRHDATIY
jgi:hypothetical protein